jgi:hypothetical protein
MFSNKERLDFEPNKKSFWRPFVLPIKTTSLKKENKTIKIRNFKQLLTKIDKKTLKQKNLN